MTLVLARASTLTPDWGATPTPAAAGEVARGSSGGLNTDRREDLIEFLDRALHFHRYQRSVTGVFPKELESGGLRIPAELAATYRFDVLESGASRFRIRAESLPETQLLESIVVDQDYRISANFPLPPPRTEYLRQLALRHLEAIESASGSQVPEEEGLFRGYFSYRFERIAGGGRRATAVGVKRPVEGIRVEGEGLTTASAGEAQPEPVLALLETGARPRLGQKGAWSDPQGMRENSNGLAAVVREEFGHYVRDLQQLRAIAARAEGSRVPAAAPAAAAVPAQTGVTASPVTVNGLVIEPIAD